MSGVGDRHPCCQDPLDLAPNIDGATVRIPPCGTPGPAVESSTQRVDLDAGVGIPQFARITKMSCGVLNQPCGSWDMTTMTSMHGMLCKSDAKQLAKCIDLRGVNADGDVRIKNEDTNWGIFC